MTHRASSSPYPAQLLGLHPPLAWIAILGFSLLSALLILAGAVKIANLAFPAGAVVVGTLLYFRAPVLYTGFTWWLWFLSPFVRRVADWKSSFTEPSPILLAPYLVALITLITFGQHLPKAYRQGGLPFIFAFIAVGYSCLVGFIYKPPLVVGIGFLDWLAPLAFGFHLFTNWRNYPSYRQNIVRVFVWGVLVMGGYGIIQYLTAPEWDVLWRENAEFMSAGGYVDPSEIRVWSTLNSPEPFADTMMAGLLILFNYKGVLLIPVSIAGYLSFLLSLVRSTWVGWFVGLFALVPSLKEKLQMRLVITIAVMVLCILPLTQLDAFSDVISSRLETFSNIEEDHSASVRQYYFEAQIGDALTSWTGQGVGGHIYDWGIFALLFNLGWLGTIFYIGGLLLLLMKLYQGSESRADSFIGVSRAVALAIFALTPLQTPFTEIKGMILWGFIGIGLAGKKYCQHQRHLQLEQLSLSGYSSRRIK